MRSKNACKTCALGMGGQLGGMANEKGHFPEVCKKSLQAMAADMRGRIERRFFDTYSLPELRALTPRELESAGRIVEPQILRPGATRFEALGWEEALSLLSDKLRSTDPHRAYFYSSGRSSNEAGFLLQLLARAYGTNNVSNCSYYCHQASGVGLRESIGTATSTVQLDDLDKCDLLFLVGGNPASNHPRFMSSLMHLRRRGGKVIVINPLREPGLVRFRVPSSASSLLFGSNIASLYLQPRIGGDIALLAGIAKVLLENGMLDLRFVELHTTGFEAVRAYLESLSWPEIEASSGVAEREIRHAAELYAASHRTVFAWTMGITHHEHGVQNVQWIANLALLRGMVGREGAGLLPIRGHSNVQGLGSIGVSPALGKAAMEGLAELGLAPSEQPGYDPLAALEAAERGEIAVALCLGGNLFGASPDAGFMEKAFGKLELAAYLSTTLNTGHVRGLAETTLILPVLPRDEESQSTTQESMFNYIRLSDGGPPRHEGPRSEVEVLAEVASRAVGDVAAISWRELRDHDAIRRLISKLVPGFADLAEIGKTKKEFHLPGRTLREPTFSTPSGKAAFCPHALPAPPSLEPGQLLLMTVRSEGQFNTVVYEEEDLYRGQERRDVILISPEDAKSLGLRENEVVTVRSEVGELDRILVRLFPIAKGCAAMYFPEANALVSRTADPGSRTPAYKSTAVTLVRGAGDAEAHHAAPTLDHLAASRDNMRAC
jgi:molybdopterin-dependent oxidoreductase alpha subunit